MFERKGTARFVEMCKEDEKKRKATRLVYKRDGEDGFKGSNEKMGNWEG